MYQKHNTETTPDCNLASPLLLELHQCPPLRAAWMSKRLNSTCGHQLLREAGRREWMQQEGKKGLQIHLVQNLSRIHSALPYFVWIKCHLWIQIKRETWMGLFYKEAKHRGWSEAVLILILGWPMIPGSLWLSWFKHHILQMVSHSHSALLFGNHEIVDKSPILLAPRFLI